MMEVIQQHEQENASDIGLKALVAVADDLFRLVADCLVDHLGDMLRSAGFFNRQRGAHDGEKDDEDGDNDQFQRVGAENGRCLR
jgi:hypothetical protein